MIGYEALLFLGNECPQSIAIYCRHSSLIPSIHYLSKESTLGKTPMSNIYGYNLRPKEKSKSLNQIIIDNDLEEAI